MSQNVIVSDPLAFARDAASLSGEFGSAELPRLAASSLELGAVRWHVSGLRLEDGRAALEALPLRRRGARGEGQLDAGGAQSLVHRGDRVEGAREAEERGQPVDRLADLLRGGADVQGGPRVGGELARALHRGEDRDRDELAGAVLQLPHGEHLPEDHPAQDRHELRVIPGLRVRGRPEEPLEDLIAASGQFLRHRHHLIGRFAPPGLGRSAHLPFYPDDAPRGSPRPGEAPRGPLSEAPRRTPSRGAVGERRLRRPA